MFYSIKVCLEVCKATVRFHGASFFGKWKKHINGTNGTSVFKFVFKFSGRICFDRTFLNMPVSTVVNFTALPAFCDGGSSK